MTAVDWDLIKTNIQSKLKKDWAKKLWPLQCKQDFNKIWPSDLLFDPIPPMIQLDRNIIKTNILSKLEEECLNTVAPRL